MTNDYAGVVLLTGPISDSTRTFIEDMQRQISELKLELETANILLKERTRVLEAIPHCRMHGSTCIPHALEWVHTVVTFADAIVDKPKSLFHE